MHPVPAPTAAINPRLPSALADDEATDRAQRIDRRIGALVLGASAVMDGIRVRRMSLRTFEIDGDTIADSEEVIAEVTYLAEERLGLDEAPITIAGQRVAAERVAVVAAARMLGAYSAQGRYERRAALAADVLADLFWVMRAGARMLVTPGVVAVQGCPC